MKNKIGLFLICLSLTGQIMAIDRHGDYGLTPTQGPVGPADQGSIYDPRDGFTYVWKRDKYGEIKLQGFHPSGATNSFRVKPNKDRDGFDPQGNYWTYNHVTGMHFNYGTGEALFMGKQPD